MFRPTSKAKSVLDRTSVLFSLIIIRIPSKTQSENANWTFVSERRGCIARSSPDPQIVRFFIKVMMYENEPEKYMKKRSNPTNRGES